MNRATATANTDGTFTWSTMAHEDERLQQESVLERNGVLK